ncbi:MAG: cupin domain-containing protein [bacterium]|nr:cupin domain-containing protein [bacterium]
MKANRNWINIPENIEYPSNGILSKKMEFENQPNGFETTLFCMSSGSELSEHTSTRKGILYVLEGSGVFNLGKEKIKMLPGTLIHMKENTIHSLAAETKLSFILLLL